MSAPTLEHLIATGMPRELAEQQLRHIAHLPRTRALATRLLKSAHIQNSRRFKELVALGMTKEEAESRIRDEWAVKEADNRAKEK